MFYHFNGVFKPNEGEVLYNGEPLDYSKEALLKLRGDICVVVQNPDEQIFSSTVESDVAFGPMSMDLPKEDVDERIASALEMVGMTEYRRRPSTQLSYGQRKRVSLAGALAVRPKVLILDEPTAGLDPQMSREVMELVDQLCCNGTTVIISTHDVDLIYSWAEDIIVLNHGNLVYSGEPEAFFADAAKTASAGVCRPHTFSVNTNVAKMRGKEETPYPRSHSQFVAKMAPEGTVGGKVRLVPVNEGFQPVAFDGPVGAYGFYAKEAVQAANVEVDYMFDALEMCMQDVVKGKDVLLYCDASMAEMARKRIESLESFGVRAEVIQ
jgi:cobalt/nickel transport system ATP-binding protein